MSDNSYSSLPLVSIIIPVYNGGNYMREAIDSALAQTYENKEIIVVNDGSCDGGETEHIALSYGDSIRYIAKENGGVSSALNAGIAEMRGEYFSWLSHDDRYTPDKVKASMDMLLRFEDKSLIALCGDCQIDKNSERLLGASRRKRFDAGRVVPYGEVLHELLRYGSFHGCALLIPKEVFDRCGGFCEDLRYSQDWLMWLSIFLTGYSLVYTDYEGVEGRVHGGQLTETGRELFHRDSIRVGELLIPRFLEVSTRKDNFLYGFAKNNGRYNNTGVVKSCIAAAKEKKLFSASQRINLKAICLYGKIRPLMRRVYYRVIKGAK